MHNTITLFKRNMKLYFRDRSAVFFSFLSSLILVVLYLMFIGKSYVNGMTDSGIPLDTKQMYFFVYNLVFVGVVVANSISIPLCAMTILTKDFENGKQNGFLLTRAKPHELVFSYFLMAAVITAALNIATWTLGTLFVGFGTGEFLGIDTILIGVCVSAVISCASSAIVTLVVAFIKSTTAINVIGGVSSTFFGFVCGIYMPYSVMGNGIKIFGSIFPFTHLTIWFKRIVLDSMVTKFDGLAEFKGTLYSSFSAENAGFLFFNVPLWITLLISFIIAAACLVSAIFILRRRVVKK